MGALNSNTSYFPPPPKNYPPPSQIKNQTIPIKTQQPEEFINFSIPKSKLQEGLSLTEANGKQSFLHLGNQNQPIIENINNNPTETAKPTTPQIVYVAQPPVQQAQQCQQQAAFGNLTSPGQNGIYQNSALAGLPILDDFGNISNDNLYNGLPPMLNNNYNVNQPTTMPQQVAQQPIPQNVSELTPAKNGNIQGSLPQTKTETAPGNTAKPKITGAQQSAIARIQEQKGKISFEADPNNQNVQVGKVSLQEDGIEKITKVYPDGTTVEINKNANKEGFWANALGTKGGFWNGAAGTAEMAAGGIIGLTTGWTGIGAVAGGSMAADGFRRVVTSNYADTTYKATITKPDNTQKVVNYNDLERLNGAIDTEIDTGSKFTL